MIFRKYEISLDGSFRQLGTTSLMQGEFNYLKCADEFLREVRMKFLPMIKFEAHDNIDDTLRDCLIKMFLVDQFKFFIDKGWSVKVCNLDVRHTELFGVTTLMDYKHAERLGVRISDPSDLLNSEMTIKLVFEYLHNLGQRTFWVEGFTSEFLIVHTTQKQVSRSGALIVK